MAKVTSARRAKPKPTTRERLQASGKIAKSKSSKSTHAVDRRSASLKPSSRHGLSPDDKDLSSGYQSRRPTKIDEEIRALEKKLGVNKKERGRGKPKASDEDGLDAILDGLDGFDQSDDSGRDIKKRKRSEDDTWLRQKRSKKSATSSNWSGEDDDFEEFDSGSGDSDDDGELMSDEEHTIPKQKTVRRENPYMPPLEEHVSQSAKYVPPAIRINPTNDSELLKGLERRIRGQLNRLTEINMASILSEFERILQQNPRQYVFSTTIDLILDLVAERTTLSDTFIALHASFLAALHSKFGSNFTTQALKKVVTSFDEYYPRTENSSWNGKQCNNIVAFLADLYLLSVVTSQIIFDFIRMFLQSVTETNTELLLRLIQNVGLQLRHDDPSSLKDVVGMLHDAMKQCDPDTVSVRTRFMVERVNDIKNNRPIRGRGLDLGSEQISRLKKQLTLTKKPGAKKVEPLGFSIDEIRQSTGAGILPHNASTAEPSFERQRRSPTPDDTSQDHFLDEALDLNLLAKKHGMSTDVRRAIFVAIMSSTNFKDAHIRLAKLKLKRSQSFEIPRVLMYCVTSETLYNHFYALVACKACESRSMRKAFEFRMWDLFRRFGEKSATLDDLNDDDEDDRPNLSMEGIMNLGQMFGYLIGEQVLPLAVLRRLNMSRLRKKTKMFCKVLFVTVFLSMKQSRPESSWRQAVVAIFSRLGELQRLVSDLRAFLQRIGEHGGIAPTPKEQAIVQEGCDLATEELDRLSTVTAST